MKLGFIGGGNMAAAMIGGLMKTGFAPGDIVVTEPQDARRDTLASEFGVNAEERAAAAATADVVVLAVKPQQLHEVLQTLPPLRAEQLVISIAAGVHASDISRWLNQHAAVIRAMPNTPALVGAGMTGLYALPGVSEAQKTQANRIMSVMGEVVWVASDAAIDAVTAISGSGPAYVFMFIEALEQAACELGLPADTARQLSIATFFGAATLARQDAAAPAELRARVTSKGGTTERGLLALEEGRVRQAIGQAARAAASRAAEMGDLFGKN